MNAPVESSVSPGGHAHVNDPSVFMHVPPPRHSPSFISHSLTSVHDLPSTWKSRKSYVNFWWIAFHSLCDLPSRNPWDSPRTLPVCTLRRDFPTPLPQSSSTPTAESVCPSCSRTASRPFLSSTIPYDYLHTKMFFKVTKTKGIR